MQEVAAAPVKERLSSVDLLRGLVMVIMLIDHARDYYFMQPFQPEDLSQTWPALFFTRWITHFCAPTFMFLAGVAAFLSLGRGKTKAELSRFLWTRGLFLLVLELAYVNFMFGNLSLNFRMGATLWALGWSMIALAGLIHLPRLAIGVVAGAMILGHNALDGFQPATDTLGGKLWTVLHISQPIQVTPNFGFMVLYPLIPWIGVMAAGFLFGRAFELDPARRRQALLRTGLAATAGFFLLRGINVYGDLAPWTRQSTAIGTAMSFLNVAKYPPSLAFLLMTLGPAILALRAFDGWTNESPIRRFLLVFGQVPMYYYVLHLTVLFVTFPLVGIATFGPNFMSQAMNDGPPAFPLGLPGAYLAWALILAVLYPLCRRYARKKRENPKPWMAYF